MGVYKGTHIYGYHEGNIGLVEWAMATQFLFAHILRTIGDYITTKARI